MDPTLRSLRDQIRFYEEQKCPICEGMGMRVVDGEDGKRYATKCECTYPLRVLRTIEKANLPTRFESCTFDNFSTEHTADPSIGKAVRTLKHFVSEWGSEENRRGLLLTGRVGAGKTHLAVATLRALVAEYPGTKVLFYDHKSLLKAIQNTYNARSMESELDVLGPVFKADVLVLDELGREKRSEWAGEMIEHILNTRYNDRLTTIITTNYPNRPPLGLKLLKSAKDEADLAVREETLGDRVGEQIYSRVQEMCYVVKMSGDDFRQTIKRASL